MVALVASVAIMPASACADVIGAVRVIDGDTMDVGTVRVRLHGIDAPEQQQTCTHGDGLVWACGAWVTMQAARLFDGAEARCAVRDRDRWGRIVARCTIGGRDMGQVLVTEGLAFAYRHYSQSYVPAEVEAARRGAGLHKSELQAPAHFRREQATERAVPPEAGCLIKGNVSSHGVRIFHSPGQRDYARTRISPEKGERWFCSAAQARAAGWREAKR